MVRTVSVLGSTGSIGTQALNVIEWLAGEFKVVALAAGQNTTLLAEQAKRHNPYVVSVSESANTEPLACCRSKGTQILRGREGLMQIASTKVDIVIVAMSGTAALEPVIAAAPHAARIALANKECVVCGGDLLMQCLRRNNTELVPVDSEHSALFQCLKGGNRDEVRRIILTASGGPFFGRSREQLRAVGRAQALRHPNWSMGAKISVDSATMMNKGLEVIEAHHIFDIDYDNISVVIHPESIVHSMVEFVDGSVIAQMGAPDMRVPIQYALTYPRRLPSPAARWQPEVHRALEFFSPDDDTFPLLKMACDAGRSGGVRPCVLSAANEIAVDEFLRENVSFLDIERIVRSVMEESPVGAASSVEEILEADAWARECARHKAALRRKGVRI